MKHPTQPLSHVLRPFLLALCLALGSVLALAAPAGATSLPARLPLVPPSQATIGVALAQIATVRVEARYTLLFTLTSGVALPSPLPGVCSGLGVLVGSTSPQGTGSTYLLTTSQVLSQAFCQPSPLTGALLKGATFEGATVYLSSAYAGAKAGQASVAFTLPKDAKGLPAASSTSPSLVLVPLTAPVGVTSAHDYPTIALSALSGSGPGQRVALDLSNLAGQALNATQLNAFTLPGTPTQTPQAQAKTFLTPISQPSTSGTLSPGTPIIDDQTGALLELAAGGGALVPVDTVPALVNALTPKPVCPGDAQCLSARWQQAMTAFYGPKRADAAPLLQSISASYSDFAGAKEFQDAATAGQTPTPGTTPVATQTTPGKSSFLGLSQTGIFLALGLLGVLLLAVIVMAYFIYVQKSRKRQRKQEAAEREVVVRSAPFAPRTPSGHIAPAGYVGAVAGAPSPVPPGAQTLPYTPNMQQMLQGGQSIPCPNCGSPNNAGSSTCAVCGNDLAQVAGAMSGGRATSHPPGASGGPARLNLPALNQVPAGMPPIPPAPEIAAPGAPLYTGGNVRAPRPEDNQITEPVLPTVAAGEERTMILPGRKRPAFGVLVSTKSDRGRKRAGKENEDNFLAVTGTRIHHGQPEPFGLFVVADGMGGHANGQDASRMTIESIFLDLAPQLTQQEVPDEELITLLQQAVQNANQKLFRQNQQDHSDMGCTMTAALVAGDEAHICNVGDSRTYLLRPNSELQRVTVDHSIVQSLVDAGVIQKDDVYTHPKRNQIYRSLGEKEVIEIDTFTQRVTPGDKLLLCCDGLWEMIRDPEIEMILNQSDDLPQASAKLIEMANEHGGVDNITAIVVKVTAPPQPTERQGRRPGIESIASGPSTLPKRVG